MGRKTFESFPKLLPNRTHVIVTRNCGYRAEGAFVVGSLEEAFELAKEDSQPFVIGGGEIYHQALPYADIIELTRVHGSFDADAYFPEISETDWELVKEEYHPKDERHNYAFTFQTFVRRSDG